MSKIMEDFQKRVLKVLSGKIGDFYLVGGTALSLYYFNHRESQDLDFFTQDFNNSRVEEIIGFLSLALKREISLRASQTGRRFVKMAVYDIPIGQGKNLKVDFVQDYIKLMRLAKTIDGIAVASLEDIYLRKIYTVAGTSQTTDVIGRKTAIGGRQEAKDFFDLYLLSHTFQRLSEFSFRYCGPAIRENIIRWFRTYSRFEMKTGLLDLSVKNPIDYTLIERHFKQEINSLIEKEVELR